MVHGLVTVAHRLLCCGTQTQQLWCAGLVAPQHVGSNFTTQESNLHPLHWKADSSFVFSFCFLFWGEGVVLSLHCCTWAFSSCGKGSYRLVVVCGLLIAMASLVAEHGL